MSPTSRSRRGGGEGSVYYVDARNEWAASISLGIDPETKKRIRQTLYGRSKKEVLQRLTDVRIKTGTTVARRKNPTLHDFALSWLNGEVKSNKRPTTYYVYESVIRRHILPYVGNLRMNAVAPVDANRIVETVRARSGTAMAGKVRLLLHRIFQRAIALELAFRNPVKAIEAPRHEKAPAKFLTAEQVRALFESARGDRLEAMVVLLATTGARIGEVIALRWCDVNLKVRSVRIERTAVEISGPVTFAPPKTLAGTRTVALGELVASALKSRLAAAKLEGYAGDDDLIFPTSTGTPWRKTNLHRRWWQPLLVKAKLPRIRVHDLRHTAASLSLAAGTNARIVSDRLGHSDPSFTARTYQHSIESLHRADAKAIDRLLRAKK